MISIKVNGSNNSLVHKGSLHFARNTAPDVCKTPGPTGPPIPIPYPVIISLSTDLSGGSTSVKADGGNMIANKGSELSRCTGDEPGTIGGIISSTNMKEATWLLYSFDVKIEGKNACRLTDKLKMNHGNTFCMAGIDGIPVTATVEEITAVLCKEMAAYQKSPAKKKSSKKLEDKCRKKFKENPGLVFAKRYPTPSLGKGRKPSTKFTIPDCTLEDGEGNPTQCFDFKLCGDRWRGDQKIRQMMLTPDRNEPAEISCEACKNCKCPT
jgi:hypothetical protein